MTRVRVCGLAAIIASIISAFVLGFLPAAAQSTAAICSVQENLEQGSTGADVTTLQSFLAAQGDFTVTPTGYFGSITEAALVEFQNATGITAAAGGNGLFGAFTRNYIATHFCTAAPITTTPPPTQYTGEISASPTSGNAPLTVTFSGVGSSITFGDGTGQNISGGVLGVVSHVYTNPGTFVANSNGLSAIVSVVASTQSGGSSSPAGSISSFTTSGPAPLAVTFYVSCANAATYDIQFGDGNDLGSAAAQAQCNGQLQTVTHTYTTDGSYEAQLEMLVQQSNGTYTPQAAGSVNIQVGLSGNTSTSTSFVVSPSSGKAPLTVQFSGNAPYPYQISTGDDGATIIEPIIDCTVQSSNCPPAFVAISGSHTYSNAGTYNAVLSSDGATVATSTITVSGVASSTNCAPSQDLTLGDSDADSNGQVSVLQTFLVDQGATIYPAQLVTGFFGNATLTGVQNFQTKYGIEPTGFVGPLTISAITTICSGGTPTTASSTPSFSASPASGNAPLSVTFTASNFEIPTAGSSFAVSFGDGSTGSMTGSTSTLTATHTYQSSGTYSALLDLEQNLCGGLTTFGCVSDLQEASTTVTVGGGGGGGGGSGTTITALGYGGGGSYQYACNSTTSSSNCGYGGGLTFTAVDSFQVLGSQQSGTIPLYICGFGLGSVTGADGQYGAVSTTATPAGYSALGLTAACNPGGGYETGIYGYIYQGPQTGTVPLDLLELSQNAYVATTQPWSWIGATNLGTLGYVTPE